MELVFRDSCGRYPSLETPMSIKILVCDDHQVIRTGLASLFAGTEIEIVGEADNGKEALKQAQKLKPDVVLLDIRMPDGDGLATLEKLRAKVPESKVVMLSTYDNPTYIARAVALGACGLRPEGLVARRHHRHDRGRGPWRVAQPHRRVEEDCGDDEGPPGRR